MTQTIYTSAGAKGSVTATITADVDISADAIQLAIGDYLEPPADTEWKDPDVPATYSADGKTATAKLFIGEGFTNPAPGGYYLWYKIADTPLTDVQPIRSERFVVA